jgi:hypothetical protein
MTSGSKPLGLIYVHPLPEVTHIPSTFCFKKWNSAIMTSDVQMLVKVVTTDFGRIGSLVFRAVLKLYLIDIQVVVIQEFCDIKTNPHLSNLTPFTVPDPSPLFRWPIMNSKLVIAQMFEFSRTLNNISNKSVWEALIVVQSSPIRLSPDRPSLDFEWDFTIHGAAHWRKPFFR